MRFRTTMRRLGVVAAATALVSGSGLAGTAGAEYVGAGVVVTFSATGLHNLQASLSYDATPFPGGAFVTFNCKAVATIDPASTGLDRCSVNGVEAVGSPNNVPGAVAVAAGITFVADGTRPVACVAAHAHFIEPILGPIYRSAPEKCEPLTLLQFAVGAPAGAATP